MQAEAEHQRQRGVEHDQYSGDRDVEGGEQDRRHAGTRRRFSMRRWRRARRSACAALCVTMSMVVPAARRWRSITSTRCVLSWSSAPVGSSSSSHRRLQGEGTDQRQALPLTR